MGLEETILRGKPPLDRTLTCYLTWLREWVRDSCHRTGYVPTAFQLGDCFTKPMSVASFTAAMSSGYLWLPKCVTFKKGGKRVDVGAGCPDGDGGEGNRGVWRSIDQIQPAPT